MLEAYGNFHMGVKGSENRPVALVRGPFNIRLKNRFHPGAQNSRGCQPSTPSQNSATALKALAAS
jgi:hypothetical protein